jgi:hypothetical protein
MPQPYLSLVDTLHVVGMLPMYKYWPCVHFPPGVGKCEAGQKESPMCVCVYFSNQGLLRVGISPSKPVMETVWHSLVSLHSSFFGGLVQHTSHRRAAYTVTYFQVWGVLVNWAPHRLGIVRPQTALDREGTVAVLLRCFYKIAAQMVQNGIIFFTNNVTKF